MKIYLLPDPQKTTKKKTKVARKTCNPTYNEMVCGGGAGVGWQTVPVCVNKVVLECGPTYHGSVVRGWFLAATAGLRACDIDQTVCTPVWLLT